MGDQTDNKPDDKPEAVPETQEEATSEVKNPLTDNPNSTEALKADSTVKEEEAADDRSDNEADPAEEDTTGDRPVSNDQYRAFKNIADILTNHKYKAKGEEDYYPSMLFRRIPNRRNLPDYHEVIKNPVAISTLKGKIQRKTYTGVPEFVQDFALIVHNAQVYNRPNSGPVRDVLELQSIFKEEMQKMVDEGLAKENEIVFPDLGEIPYATPEPDPASEDEDENDDDQEDDEDDEDVDGDDSDDDRAKRKGRRSRAGRKDRDDDDGRKRRGRPPRVDTPMEARMKAILKGLRKPKDAHGNLLIRHFERLPDKQEYPAYFMEIKDPIAIDTIKKKQKRKKYQTLDHFVKDLDLLFNNAKQFNEDSSEIYQDAVVLHAETQKLAELEKAKPDDEYLLEDGRRPLPAGILYKNELWKVGDWVHIKNSNDLTKPIVAQIYRTWEDTDGQKWINACWYYRPEQTVHQYEKHFFPNEVVKTGQYRDHQIEEVIDRCFVMFYTRFSRGRPKGFDTSKEVYVCEARYNEDKHRFNKIKTWASCLPDEVRDKDYEMDLFDNPRRIKKLPSPLKYLLKSDAKETDKIPSPEWGHPNAPPLVGGIHKQPRDENQSPPPEPTPPPPPTPPTQPVRQPSTNNIQRQPSRPELDPRRSTGPGSFAQLTRPSPPIVSQMSPYQTQQSISPAPQYARQTSYQQTQGPAQIAVAPHTPTPPQVLPYAAHQQLHPTPALAAAVATGYTGTPSTQNFSRPQNQPGAPYGPYGASATLPLSRDQDVFVLPDNANESIPREIRDRFPQDGEGRLLFFTKPPVVVDDTLYDRNAPGKTKVLAHSERHLAAKAERAEKIAARKRKLENEGVDSQAKRSKVIVGDNAGDASKPEARELVTDLVHAAENWVAKMINETEAEYQALYGSNWQEIQREDIERRKKHLERDQELQAKRDQILAQCRNTPVYDTNFSRNLWASGCRGERY